MSKLIQVSEWDNMKRMLICFTNHWESAQYTHRITCFPFTSTVKVFPRCCLTKGKFGAPNRNTTSIWSYVIHLTTWGRDIGTVFPGYAFWNSAIMVLSMVMSDLCVSATLQGNIHNHVDQDISRLMQVGPRFILLEIRRIKCRHTPKGFLLPIVESWAQATLWICLSARCSYHLPN